MLACPNCGSELPTGASDCTKCAWRFETIDGIPSFLSDEDRRNPLWAEYTKNYQRISEIDLNQSIQHPTFLRAQTRKAIRYLGSVTGLSICEVGVGQGLMLAGLAEQAPQELVGVDISPAYLDVLRRRGFAVIAANAENLPYRRHFDLLVATDVIEHVINVADFLVSANQALKPAGKLFLRAPLEENLMPYARRLGSQYPFVHLRSFTDRSMRLLLKDAGFRIQSIWKDGFQPYFRRPFTKKNDRLSEYVDKYLSRRFANDFDIANISNFVGRILMKPTEISVLAVRESDPRQPQF